MIWVHSKGDPTPRPSHYERPASVRMPMIEFDLAIELIEYVELGILFWRSDGTYLEVPGWKRRLIREA